MAKEKPASFIRVDEVLPQVTLEQAADFYGVDLPELRRIGHETRARCFLNCGRTEETGDRALAIREDEPTKPWTCHQYGCTKRGNLVGLCDLMKPGENAGGRPRGERFKAIAHDLQRIVQGGQTDVGGTDVTPPKPVSPPVRPVNAPLSDSENERARALLDLDREFVTDPARMPPEAASYFRRRPFLTPEACAKWRIGYLPQSATSLLRGRIVYAYHSAEGVLLSWFGRDPKYETKHEVWKKTDRSNPEPVKTRFVKGFQRGLELWGEHAIRTSEALTIAERVGLVVVEGPNDAINLQSFGVPAVALCSNTVTAEQVDRVAALTCDMQAELVTLMLDCDEEGEAGVRQALPLLAERIAVRLAWRRSSHGGRYKDRQPESFTREEWEQFSGSL